MTVRVVSMVMAAGVVAMLAAGTVIVSQVRSQLFDREVTTAVDLFEASRSNAQASFDSLTSPTAAEIQDEANQIVQAQYDPIRAVMGATMLRAPDQSDSLLPILEPYTQSPVEIRDLISTELRAAVPNSDAIHWQSVALPASSGGPNPGIIVGAPLNVEGAGTYADNVA